MGVSGENSQNISLVIRRLSRIGRNPINSFKPFAIVGLNETSRNNYAETCVNSGTWNIWNISHPHSQPASKQSNPHFSSPAHLNFSTTQNPTFLPGKSRKIPRLTQTAQKSDFILAILTFLLDYCPLHNLHCHYYQNPHRSKPGQPP